MLPVDCPKHPQEKGQIGCLDYSENACQRYIFFCGILGVVSHMGHYSRTSSLDVLPGQGRRRREGRAAGPELRRA